MKEDKFNKLASQRDKSGRVPYIYLFNEKFWTRKQNLEYPLISTLSFDKIDLEFKQQVINEEIDEQDSYMIKSSIYPIEDLKNDFSTHLIH